MSSLSKDNKKISSNGSDIRSYRKIKLEHYLSMFALVAKSFDKAILGLSTASLGFTFAFLKLILKENIHYIWMLKASWIGFILAVIFIILALILAENYALHKVKFHSSKILQSKIKVENKRCIDKFMGLFQYLSVFSFVSGLSFLRHLCGQTCKG